jgi:DNA-binding SARP family transcriptional activator/predicted ATPase/tetratricopeptide (TPR) repeat protein
MVRIMAHLALKLFGSYRLVLAEHTIDNIESDKARALLAYLAIENGHPVSREKLAGNFWPEQSEEHARGSLSQALYHLRGVLGDRLLTGILPTQPRLEAKEPYLLVSPREIRFNPRSDFETDVGAFLVLIKACKAHAHPPYKICDDCLPRYQEAASLYMGDFLDGFYLPKSVAFEEWATVLREQLHLEVMDVLEALVWAFERQGDLEKALVHARRMVHLDDLSEIGNQHVMRLLALLGRRGEALAQYASFHQTLALQIGGEPGLETKALYQRLRSEEAGTASVNLPASLTPIIGRRQELDDLWTLLRDPNCRLICIQGFGGSGKTRLALEAAYVQRYYFGDGIYFVPLSTLGADSSLLATIAEGLGFSFREFGDKKRQLLDYLRHKKVLLLLDSFETVAGSAGLVADILSASEGSKALVTSRVRLNLSGEKVYPLRGMKVPLTNASETILDYSSVELFLDAARRVSPGYTPDSLEGVARICQLVEGMPLGLLMASTWVSDYTTQQIADQISHSLDFLSVEWADLPARQRGMRATFKYSWDLLSGQEQDVLMSLAVFRNPFTPKAASTVAGASPQLLHALVGKCLLGSIAESKFQMHDLVQQYSEEMLTLAENDQERTVRQRHGEYFLDNVAGWGKLFKGPGQSATLAEADKEIEDVKAAWGWVAQSGDPGRLMKASEGLFLYFLLRYRFQEGENACQVAIESVQGELDVDEWMNLEGWLLAWRVSFCRALGKVELARQLLDASQEKLELAEASGEDARQGKALLWRERDFYATKLQEKLDCLQHSATLYQSLGDIWSQAGVLCWAGEYANRLGDYELALNLHQQAETLSRSADDPRRLGEVLKSLGYDHLIYGPWEAGARLMEEAALCIRSVGDLGSQASADLHLAVSLGWMGRYPEACQMMELALVKMYQLGDRFYVAYGTGGLGIGQMHSGKYTLAVKTLQDALTAARQDGLRREETHDMAQIGCLALALGEPEQALADLQNSVAGFRQMGYAGELGMALGGLALSQHRLGQYSQAWAALWEALRIAVETHSRFTLFTLPAALVVLLADARRWEQAVEAYAVVMTDPIVANSRWFADMVGNRMDLAREHLPAEVLQAAESRGREGDLFDALGRLAVEISTKFEVPARHT